MKPHLLTSQLDSILKNTTDPSEVKSDIEYILKQIEDQSPNIEKMAAISLDLSSLKEKSEAVNAEATEQKEILDTLSKNIEANSLILQKNLQSFEERLKKLSN